jgi:hypothetical protein
MMPAVSSGTTHSAAAALPYRHLAAAARGLRAELRHQLLDRGPGLLPDWNTFRVTGPVDVRDARGGVWFEYTATVESREDVAPSDPWGR